MSTEAQPTLLDKDTIIRDNIDELIEHFKEMMQDPEVIAECERVSREISTISPEQLLRRFTI